MYEPFLDDIARCRDVNEDDFEIDTGWCNELQGLAQEDSVLKDKGQLAAPVVEPQGKSR